MKTCTDLEGIFPVDVVVHRQHGHTEARQEDAAKNPLLLFVCRDKNEPTQCIRGRFLTSIPQRCCNKLLCVTDL